MTTMRGEPLTLAPLAEFEKVQDSQDNKVYEEKYLRLLDVFREDVINYGKIRLESYKTFRDNLISASKAAAEREKQSQQPQVRQVKKLEPPPMPAQVALEVGDESFKTATALPPPPTPPPPTMSGGADDEKVVFDDFKKHALEILDRYMEFHRKFLKSFGRRLRYLWRYSPDKTAAMVQKLFKDAVDPFYQGFASITNSAQSSGSTHDMFVHSMLTTVIDRTNSDREKLYDFYNNKLSSMDLLFNMTFVTMYVLKLIRACIIFGALFLASRTFQARYVSKVFANNEDPPNLLMFVVMYAVIESIFMVFLVIIMFLMKKVTSTLIDEQIFSNFLIDYAVSSVIIVILGLLLSMIVMKKKYFRYKSDGLRAIRSLQEMMFYVSFVVLLFPYYVLNVG